MKNSLRDVLAKNLNLYKIVPVSTTLFWNTSCTRLLFLFQQISPLHLACQRGHMEVVNLLLEWKADVSFRSIDGRNALDYAIDFGQRSCVLTLIKHETWKESLKNAYVYSRTG